MPKTCRTCERIMGFEDCSNEENSFKNYDLTHGVCDRTMNTKLIDKTNQCKYYKKDEIGINNHKFRVVEKGVK